MKSVVLFCYYGNLIFCVLNILVGAMTHNLLNIFVGVCNGAAAGIIKHTESEYFL